MNMTTYNIQNAIGFLVDNTNGIQHGNSSYLEHCLGVYNILKEFGAPENVCLAGLYHSVYGSDSFNPNLSVTRQQILELIGFEAEQLVFNYCNMQDRDNVLLGKDNKDELFFISYANLKEQANRNSDTQLHALVKQYEAKLDGQQDVEVAPEIKLDFEYYDIDGKDVFIFDNILDRSQVDLLNNYCLNSRYTCDHASSQLNVELDSRFVSYMSKDEFKSTNLVPVIKKIGKLVDEKLYLGSYYINHYAPMTNVSRHTDSSLENTYTTLVFCNKHWDDTWGGEIKFYSERSKVHYTIDYVPGRVIFFDSRLEHKVMPLTAVAKKSRFTMAIKGSLSSGLENLKSMYGNNNLIDVDNE